MKWSAAELNTPDRLGKPIYSENPMKDFLQFILYETNPEFETIVHSHFGGRYDNILAAREVYQLNDIKTNFIARGKNFFNNFSRFF